jgi:tetraacyldisaccharide 4'-kinase
VHRALNPDVPVHVAADRVAGVRAAHKDGSTVAILDDAFQHRAIRADANLVLVAAEDGLASPRLLPRGPWREPLAALERADMVVVTRKAASSAAADAVAQRLHDAYPGLPQAQANLRISGLAPYESKTSTFAKPKPLSGFRGRLALAGVAKPETVWAQLSKAGAVIEEYRAFPDHHRYTQRDAEKIRRDSGSGAIVATLKDAVKLSAFLENDEMVFVPVQEVSWERGAEEVERLLAKLIGSETRD